MKVCVDIQAAITQRAGVGRYTRALVEHLGAQAGDDQLALFYFGFKRKGIPFPVSGAELKAVRWLSARLVQKAWNRWNAPAFDRFSGPAEVFHFPNFIRPPLRKGRSVVTIHDLSFLRHPETTEAKNLAFLKSQIKKTIDGSDALITVSQFSANEIEDLLKLKARSVHPIHLGLDATIQRPARATVADVLLKLKLDRPYILTVGTLEPRKNHLFLIDVFEKMDFDGDLVIAGMRGWKNEPIIARMQSSSKADRIRYLEFVPEEFLASLYAGAQLFLFPSIYEGFGFPPLEAMVCGTPVLSSSAGSLAEVLGDAAEVLEGHHLDEWVANAGRLLQDMAACDTLRARGFEQVKQFRWEETAKKTWDVYRAVAP